MKSKYLLIALSMAFSLTSCNEELFKEVAGGNITIDRIYYENAASSTTKEKQTDYARIGQTIRLTGSGFQGLKHVYVNGYDTYFNLQYLTNTSMLVTIDDNTPIEQVNDSKDKDVIRLENDNFSAKKSLKIRRGAPSVFDISNSMPNPGEWITIYGENLQHVSYVTFPGSETQVTAADGLVESDDVNGTYVKVKVPTTLNTSDASSNQNQGAININADDKGNGICNTPAYFNYRKGLIETFDTKSIYHHNTDGGTMANIYSDALPSTASDEVCSNTGTFAMLNNVPGHIVGVTSTAAKDIFFYEFYDGIKNVPSELDDLGAAQVALQFNVYVGSDWTSGNIDVVFGIDDRDYVFTYAPWVDGVTDSYSKGFTKGSWFTVTMPFSSITAFRTLTFKEIREKIMNLANDANGNAMVWGVYFENQNQIAVINGVSEEYKASNTVLQPCIDNIRIVPLTVEVEEAQ